MNQYKQLVVVGDATCGKTCLLIAFALDDFPWDYIPSAFNYCGAAVEVDGKKVELELSDTAGGEDYDRLRPLVYPGKEVILMCFAIDNPDSFENISQKWAPEVKTHARDVPFFLVGNKKDLQDDETVKATLAKRQKKPVTFNEGKYMAEQIGAEAYIECSAKTREGVLAVFVASARAAIMLKQHQKRKKKCVLI